VQGVLLAVHNMTAKEGSPYGTHDRVRRAAREPGCDARRQEQRIAQVKPNKASPIRTVIIVPYGIGKPSPSLLPRYTGRG